MHKIAMWSVAVLTLPQKQVNSGQDRSMRIEALFVGTACGLQVACQFGDTLSGQSLILWIRDILARYMWSC